MEVYIKKYGKNSLVISLVFAIISIFLIAKPTESLQFIIIVVGCILILTGLFHTISYFTSSKDLSIINLGLIQGVLCLIFGIVTVFNSDVVGGFLPFLIGAWIIIESILKIQFTFNIRNISISRWRFMLLLSLLTLIIGIIILFNPFKTAVMVTRIYGIFLLIAEVLNIFESIYMLKYR